MFPPAEIAAVLIQQTPILEILSEGVIVVDPEGAILYTNAALDTIYGYAKGELVGRNVSILATGSEEADDLFRLLTSPGVADSAAPEVTLTRRDGTPVSVCIRERALQTEAGLRWISFHEDVTERRLTEAALREHQEQYRALLDNIDLGITLIDDSYRILMINGAHGRLFGRDSRDFIHRHCFRELAGVDAICPTCPGTVAMATGRPATIESEGKAGNGTRFAVRIKAFPVFDADGVARKFIEVVEDITDRKTAERRIEQLAYYDILTTLPNRTLLMDRLRHLLAHARRRGRKVGVIFLDLDRFKGINDTRGHKIGDELLKAVGDRLAVSVRDTDTVARLGGDEFVIVVGDVVQEDDLSIVAGKLMAAFIPPFMVDGHEIFITASLGIAIFPADGDSSGKLLTNADTAMYAAKEAGRNTYKFFSREMNERAVERVHLENELRRAVTRGELYLCYQPQVEARSGAMVGMEALLRWKNPILGEVPPRAFIPVAEDCGAIVEIGEWVLREAMKQLEKWHDNGYAIPRMAVNLSARQFRHDYLLGVVKEVLRERRLPARHLELELTESMLMNDVAQATKTLEQMKALGVSLAVDDFGTGYSSLSYLKTFPLDRLKIDQSFIRDLPTSDGDAAIVGAIIGMATSLGMDVIAEGVETAEQMEHLYRRGCREMQGYHFARPLTAEELTRYLEKERLPHLRARVA